MKTWGYFFPSSRFSDSPKLFFYPFCLFQEGLFFDRNHKDIQESLMCYEGPVLNESDREVSVFKCGISPQ